MESVDQFLDVLDGMLRTTAPEHRVREVETLLAQVGASDFEVPDEYLQVRSDRYARYCLALPEDKSYSVILMAWAPAQSGPIHDHDHLWCVECVLRGSLKITRYEPKEKDSRGRVRFKEHETIIAGKGETGHLIPPLEYHRLQNASESEPAYTLHVYGGEMKSCTAFIPEGDGFCRRQYVQYSTDEQRCA